MAYVIRKSYLHFDPSSDKPYRLSRSRIERFMECARCFWLNERYGVDRPGMPAFSLNNAVDTLLKKEFDIHRDGQTPHPLLANYGLKLVPLKHERMDEWRDSLRRGIEHHHKPSNFSFRGGVDDVWTDDTGTLYIVDYKATSTEKEIDLNDQWKQGYKRQMEMYQWLFRQNGFTVSDTGYFVYVNGKADRKAFDAKLEFDVQLIPYAGNDGWVEGALMEARACLMNETIPASGERCEYCPYREAAGKKLLEMSFRLTKKKDGDAADEEPTPKVKRTIKIAKPEYEASTGTLF
jgi:CRISPR/Cas system-associated exonuclease Cas4 (RecB family)